MVVRMRHHIAQKVPIRIQNLIANKSNRWQLFDIIDPVVASVADDVVDDADMVVIEE